MLISSIISSFTLGFSQSKFEVFKFQLDVALPKKTTISFPSKEYSSSPKLSLTTSSIFSKTVLRWDWRSKMSFFTAPDLFLRPKIRSSYRGYFRAPFLGVCFGIRRSLGSFLPIDGSTNKQSVFSLKAIQKKFVHLYQP